MSTEVPHTSPPAPGRTTSSSARGDGQAGALLLFLGIALIVGVMVNTSLGYLQPGTGGFSFLGLSRRLFWLILLVSLAIASSVSYRMALLAVSGACGMVFFRVLSGVFSSSALILASYRLCYSLVIALAAAILYNRARGLFEAVLKTVVVLSVPVLLLQLLGVSEFVHSWNTLATGLGGVRGLSLLPTFLVDDAHLVADYRQLRPPGLFYANSVSAVFLIFAVSFRYCIRTSRVGLYDLLLVYMALLMMAKVAILFLMVVTVGRYFVSKEPAEKAATLRLIAASLGLFLLHSVLFPGVVSTMLSRELFFLSAWIRLADLLESVGVDFTGALGGLGVTQIPILGLQLSDLEGLLQLDSTRVAGKFSDIRLLVVLSPLFLWMWARLRQRLAAPDEVTRQQVRRSAFLTLAIFFVFAASPLLGTPLIALLFGPALVPLLAPISSKASMYPGGSSR